MNMQEKAESLAQLATGAIRAAEEAGGELDGAGVSRAEGLVSIALAVLAVRCTLEAMMQELEAGRLELEAARGELESIKDNIDGATSELEFIRHRLKRIGGGE